MAVNIPPYRRVDDYQRCQPEAGNGNTKYGKTAADIVTHSILPQCGIYTYR